MKLSSPGSLPLLFVVAASLLGVFAAAFAWQGEPLAARCFIVAAAVMVAAAALLDRPIE